MCQTTSPEQPNKGEKKEGIRVTSVSEFIQEILKVSKENGTEIFYRGHADRRWTLVPSIFRKKNFITQEHLLYRDMVAHEPQSFSECKSALDDLVQMQHYGLPTRLLDLTINPFVALYFACEQCKEKEGMVYLFSIPENNVKHYDSDTVSVLANLSKCKEEELKLALYPTTDIIGADCESKDISFYKGLRLSPQAKKKGETHEEVSFLRSVLKQDGAKRGYRKYP
nr:FRG domain-containing protein [uncultured Porphyromonas sp.]